MTPRNSLPTLAISFVLLGLVAWMAAAHPADGKLFAANPSQVDRPAASQMASASPPAVRGAVR